MMVQTIYDTVSFLQKHLTAKPSVGIVLGSGLGNFAQTIEVEQEFPYSQIPNFPVSTVEGHSGKILFGKIEGKYVIAMAGRFHYYEGYTTQEIVFPVRVMKFLGVEHLFLSNAAGSVNPAYQVGDLMVLKDHISFFTPNPLLGKNDSDLGPRFPDMSEPYDKQLIQKAMAIGREKGIRVFEGVYAAVTGPTFETRAEYKMLRILGADVVGMSTVPEVIAANHLGMKVFAVSVVTDVGIREEENTITHEEVLAAAKAAEPHLTYIFKALIGSLP